MALAEAGVDWRMVGVVSELGPGVIFQRAFELGRRQVQSFRDGSGPIWLEVWVGGETGGVYRTGRSMVYHSFDLTQTLVARRNGLMRRLENGGAVEVHDPAVTNGWPRYVSVIPSNLDLQVWEEQMRGVLSNLDGSHSDYRARVVLERALAGETFSKNGRNKGGDLNE
ncbi:MAG: hypothetical protein HY381_02745 [Candidatus Chisholmbacteria bacterium]|nr:hypothetical protein [Candidatus Chisholmbacteria bacterium]